MNKEELEDIIYNILFCAQYDIPFSQQFGCNIKSMIGDIYSSVDFERLKYNISTQVKKYLPEYNLVSLNLNLDGSGGQYLVLIKLLNTLSGVNNGVTITINNFLTTSL